MTVLIAAENLGKTYRLYDSPWDRLREMLGGRARHQVFEALQGIDFEVLRGQSLGLIGENGAGKSTLLRILAGVTPPTTGTLTVAGKVASLLELGMGFHPEFSGRQNIRLNAAVLGLSEDQVAAAEPEIIAFSELGEFIDRPVKTYSTGMVMRLGFSIAIQVDPEILIIDEALSVGDGYFQKKCVDRIRAFLDGGRTLVFCSHSMYHIAAFCQHALWLRGGEPAGYGSAELIIREYDSYLIGRGGERRNAGEVVGASTPELSEGAVAPAKLVEVSQPGRERLGAVYQSGEPWRLAIRWHTENPELAFHVGVSVERLDGVQVCGFSTHWDGLEPLSGSREYRHLLQLPQLKINHGEFTLVVFLLDEAGLHIYDTQQLTGAFRVESRKLRAGLFEIEHTWVRQVREVTR